MIQRQRLIPLLSMHWFPIVAAAALGLIWLLARDPMFMKSGGEAAILADLCITMPVLYALCYRRTLSPPGLALRVTAIACSGVCLAAWIIPADHRQLLPALEPVRLVGIAVIAVIEVRLILTAVRLTFSGQTNEEDLARRTNTPVWIARLMLLEARFWKAVWRFIRRS